MKGFMKKGVVMAVACCVFLNGCGTGMTKLTEEEEKLIVAYASGTVAKANKYQSQGLTYPVQKPEEEVRDTETEEPQTDDTQDEDTQMEEQSGQDTPTGEPDKPAAHTATLTEALNLASVTAEYRGYQITKNYIKDDYFALNADAGNTFLILSIDLNNTSDQPIECNLLSKNMASSLLVNGTAAAAGMTTILLNDFMSYMGTLDAASGEETILIFQVPEDSVGDIQSLAMELEADGSMYYIELE